MKLQPISRALRCGALTATYLVTAMAAQLNAGDVLEIVRDTVLDPRKTYNSIVIKASNVSIDGQGAWLLGPAARKPRLSAAEFRGVAISARGVSNVRLRNLNARGWKT